MTPTAPDPPHGKNAGASGDQLLTVNEVAVLLRVSKMTVYRHINNGTLPAVRIGRSFRVDPAELSTYLAATQLDPADHLGPSWTHPTWADPTAESDT